MLAAVAAQRQRKFKEKTHRQRRLPIEVWLLYESQLVAMFYFLTAYRALITQFDVAETARADVGLSQCEASSDRSNSVCGLQDEVRPELSTK